ncbi:MAG: RluA family pseudouridine synthase [Bacilli bacterium]|nr:RluA family pseudouridine synthase [Bacilli bacterium]
MEEDILTYTITPEYQKMRIDKVLSDIYPHFSRTRIQNMMEDEDVLVNDKIVKPSYKVKEGDVITLTIYPDISSDIVPEDIPLDIIYEDNDIIVVNKPQGMVVHPANGHYTGTLVNALLYHFKDQLSSIGGTIRPGIVHRIDKDTSGLLVVAKNDLAHEKLSAQLKDKTAYREYVCLVHGELTHDEGEIRAPIGRHNKDRKKMAVVSEGKPAVTHFKVLERFHGYTYLVCLLETGRTHQIRVHLSYIHYPIVGDKLYGIHDPIPLNGQLLHARKLSLIHPTSGERMTFEAPLPDYFSAVLTLLREKGSLD